MFNRPSSEGHDFPTNRLPAAITYKSKGWRDLTIPLLEFAYVQKLKSKVNVIIMAHMSKPTTVSQVLKYFAFV